MAEVDIGTVVAGMDYGRLMGLREQIDQRIREMRETEAPVLRARFEEQAAALGMTLGQIVGKRPRGRPRKVDVARDAELAHEVEERLAANGLESRSQVRLAA